MIGKFPVCALHLKTAYEAVDVNVHPNKLEVRFRDERAVSEAVVSLVLEALKEADAFDKPVQMQLLKEKDSKETKTETCPTKEEIQQGLQKPDAIVRVMDKVPSSTKQVMPLPESAVMKETTELRPFTRPEARKETGCAKETADGKKEKAEQVNTILPEIPKTMRVFGALFNTFILVEYEDQLLMVDQHAVHERLLFDRLMKEQNGFETGQELLVPIVLSVSRKEQNLIEENRELFESIGLVMERFGEHEAAVRTIPRVLGEAETGSFVRDILAEAEKAASLTTEKKRSELLQTACKHAVKGGEALTEDQLRSILDEMLIRKVTPTCPHGRPLVISISHREIDRKFKRIQG